jgi:hypothetical protein
MVSESFARYSRSTCRRIMRSSAGQRTCVRPLLVCLYEPHSVALRTVQLVLCVGVVRPRRINWQRADVSTGVEVVSSS